MFENLFNEISSWDFFKNTPLPIAVYGTGNGADKVFAEFEWLGIKAYAVIASDGFVRKRTFRGFEVKSVSQLENEIGDFAVAVAFASPLPEVIENIKNLSLRHKVLMPSVSVYGNEIFNKNFLKSHLNEIETAYSLLQDRQSKKVFENILRFQITGDLTYCFDCESGKDEAYEILNLNNAESYLDLGAYRGDTVDEFLRYVKGYEKITAVEPDLKTYKKLTAHCESLQNCATLNNSVWSENCTLFFEGSRGRGSSAKSQGTESKAVCVDWLTENFGRFSYMNIDIEGAEKEMLCGAKMTLKNHKPKICMAVYHKSEDIFALVNQINEINPQYKIYMRHHPHLTFWETNIYCI